MASLTVLAACAAYEDGPPEGEQLDPPREAVAGEAGEDLPSYEEFRSASEVLIGGRLRHAVELDILLSSERELRAYYEAYVLDRPRRSIINIHDGERDLRPEPLDIRYCLAAGWGTTQYDTDGDGTLDATAPSKSSVVNALAAAAPAWAGAARVRFVYVPTLDGSGCSTSSTNPGVDFVVQHYEGTSIAFGPRPSDPWEEQELLVPTGGISALLAMHELGHALGFRHEHIHSDASPRCNESGAREELTGYDAASAMVYANCTQNSNIAGNRVSLRDGIGARTVYGNPDWWAGVM